MRQLNKTLLNTTQRQYSQLPEIKRSKEAKLVKHLKQALHPTFLSVQDTTLGANSCGSMYKIIVESPFFAEKSKVEQHKLVAQAIKAELPNIHGYNLKTRIPQKMLTEQAQTDAKLSNTE